MRVIYALAAAFVSLSAHADVHEPIASFAQSNFATLKAWSTQGRAMTLRDLDGFYAGRCFAAHTPNRPEAAMIGTLTRNVGPDRGPAFPSPRAVTKMVTVQAWGNDERYFDGDDAFPANKCAFENELRKNWARTSAVIESPTLSYKIDWENNGRYDEGHSYVRYQNYILETWSALLSQTYGDGWGYHAAGDTLAMCYYFKKLN